MLSISMDPSWFGRVGDVKIVWVHHPFHNRCSSVQIRVKLFFENIGIKNELMLFRTFLIQKNRCTQRTSNCEYWFHVDIDPFAVIAFALYRLMQQIWLFSQRKHICTPSRGILILNRREATRPLHCHGAIEAIPNHSITQGLALMAPWQRSQKQFSAWMFNP